MASDQEPAGSLCPDPAARPQIIYVLLDADDFMSAHATWEGAHLARESFLAEVRGYWLEVGTKPPRSIADDAVRIEAVELQPGPEPGARLRELDETRTLRIANGWLSQIHLSDGCMRPNGHCWIHDPSPYEVHPLRDAPVYASDAEVIYRACTHGDHPDDEPRGVGLHLDPDWRAFASFSADKPVSAPHPCCESWCCLPQPPTEEDHARAAQLVQAAKWLSTSLELDPVTPDDERQILQDCVLQRLARARKNQATGEET